MEIRMTRNAITGTYEYQPEPKFTLRHLLAPGVFDILAVVGFMSWVLASAFL